MSEGLARLKLLSVTRRMFRVFNSLTRPALGEQILLLEFKLRVAADLRSQVDEDGYIPLTEDFEAVRFYEYETILSTYRSTKSWGKLKVLWVQLSR